MFIPNGVLYGWYWYVNELPKLLVELAWSLPSPFGIICMLIIAVFAYAWWLFLLIAIYKFRKHKDYYTLTDCSVCGKPTGFKGNKRFNLLGGYMCETCASKVLVASSVNLAKLPPEWFVMEPRDYSVQDVKGIVQRYDEVGKEQFLREIKAAEAERRKKGLYVPNVVVLRLLL